MIKFKKLAFLLVGLLFLLLLFLLLANKPKEKIIKKEYYVAGTNEVVLLYDKEFNGGIEVNRGLKVISDYKEIINKDDENDKNIYYKIKYDKENYYIKASNLVVDYNDVVLEEKLYVRTPITVYKDDMSSKILSRIKKGEELEVVGFDKLEDGVVNKYKVKYNDLIGYVYGKYLLASKEEALKVYDFEGNYEVHKNRGNTLGGGSAKNLDYYPREKPVFENNKMPNEVRALYLNTGVIKNIDNYIKLAKEANINALVIDVKDNTTPGYSSEVMKEYSPTNYNKAHNSFDNYKDAIKKVKDANLYAIGRITVFKDSYFVTDNPNSAIVDTKTNKPFNHNGSFWPTAFDRKVWEFNVELAKEAVTEMGFDEIQFDYIRFPDRTSKLEKDKVINMKNIYNEDKAEAIQGFLMYATDELHQLGVYVSADVFGEAAHPYVTGYGQYWVAISNVVDVISPMPYPDHFNANEYGFKEIVWTIPYKLLKFWGENYVVKRQKETATPAIVRNWLQTYDAIRPPYNTYDTKMIQEQIQAFYDAGFNNGFMTWNGGSSLSKYKSVENAFKKTY